MMKTVSLLGAVLAVGRVASASDCLGVALTAIPSCAQSCFLDNAPSVGCGGTDFDCQCAQEAALYAAVEGCVSSSCPEASYQPVIDGASSVCACVSPSAAGGGGSGGSGSMTVSGSVGSIPASGTVSVPSSAPASVSATVTSGGGATTTSSGGGMAGGGAGWTPTSVSNVATASVISAAHHQAPWSLSFFGYSVCIVVAAVMAL